MGRKSLSEARTNEILDAFGRCIIKYGLDTSLEQVAEEAGMTRSIIRHYIGNREEVVNTLIERVTHDYLNTLQRLGDGIPDEKLIDLLLDYLFGGLPDYDAVDKLILDILMTAKNRYPVAKQRLRDLFTHIITLLANDFQRLYSHNTPDKCREVAYGVLCLAMSNESFVWIGMDAQHHVMARQQAIYLIESLH
ncbi:MAG: TetR/AcrR family transcriptional regulator [Anaerolineae bacterium]|nr:TetR/AcrR family transcriptional regulator [Anaerolineae bacterium]